MGTFFIEREFDSDFHSWGDMTKILILIILGLSFSVTNAFPVDEKPNPDKEEVKELVLTPDQMEKYACTYKDPYVLHIRKVINNYLSGKLVGDDNYKAFTAVDQEYLVSAYKLLPQSESSFRGKPESSTFKTFPPGWSALRAGSWMPDQVRHDGTYCLQTDTI